MYVLLQQVAKILGTGRYAKKVVSVTLASWVCLLGAGAFVRRSIRVSRGRRRMRWGASCRWRRRWARRGRIVSWASFYFLTHDENYAKDSKGDGPYDVARILAQDP